MKSVLNKQKATLNNKSLEPDGFTGEFCQIFKKELTPTVINLFQKKEGTLSNSFYKAKVMILKPDKETTHTHIKANITDKHRLKNPQQNVSKLNSTTH